MVDVARDAPARRAGESEGEDAPTARARITVDRITLALLLVPVIVAAVALLLGPGVDYFPTADHALTEMQVRDVGRHEVLVGLYSRADWNHPGLRSSTCSPRPTG